MKNFDELMQILDQAMRVLGSRRAAQEWLWYRVLRGP